MTAAAISSKKEKTPPNNSMSLTSCRAAPRTPYSLAEPCVSRHCYLHSQATFTPPKNGCYLSLRIVDDLSYGSRIRESLSVLRFFRALVQHTKYHSRKCTFERSNGVVILR